MCKLHFFGLCARWFGVLICWCWSSKDCYWLWYNKLLLRESNLLATNPLGVEREDCVAGMLNERGVSTRRLLAAFCCPAIHGSTVLPVINNGEVCTALAVDIRALTA